MRSLVVPWQGVIQTRRGTRTEKPPHKRQGMAAKVPATTRAGGEPWHGLPRGLGGTPTLPNPDLTFLASRTGTQASGTRLATPGDHGTGTPTRAVFSSVTCTEAHASLRVVRLVTINVKTGRQPRVRHARLQQRSGGRALAGPPRWLAERRRASWRPHPAPPLCVRTGLSRARVCAQNPPPPPRAHKGLTSPLPKVPQLRGQVPSVPVSRWGGPATEGRRGGPDGPSTRGGNSASGPPARPHSAARRSRLRRSGYSSQSGWGLHTDANKEPLNKHLSGTRAESLAADLKLENREKRAKQIQINLFLIKELIFFQSYIKQ